MMTQKEIFDTALRQSAVDLNCSPEDFLSRESKIVPSVKNDGARKYLTLPFACDMVSYGSCIVASVGDGFADVIRDFLGENPLAYTFEARELIDLNERLKPLGVSVYRTGEYWLPELSRLRPLDCGYELKVLTDFSQLYLPEWSNALCADRKELDVLGVGAYDGDKLVGLAGCSADCEKMRQIGVDVLLEYRRRGIASAITSRLALEILERGKVPFYCCAWANMKSAKNAVRCGFFPAWAEVTIKMQEEKRHEDRS